MQEHGPQEAVRGNSCGIYTFLVIHGYSPMGRIEQKTLNLLLFVIGIAKQMIDQFIF
jgi:hypothetical protein